MEITPRFDQSVSMRIINDEISGVYGQELLTEIQSLIRFYNIYDFGADFAVEGAKDYAPAKMPYKKARNQQRGTVLVWEVSGLFCVRNSRSG